MGERAWASALLAWELRGQQLVAEISRCRYFCRAHGREVLAWCEPRDVSGRRRCDIGSYPTVAAAKAACELHAAARCRRDREATDTHVSVDVRIAPPGRGRRASGAAHCRYRQ